ncbi:MAG: helix-turn-helix domain-containing protein [Bacteroidales bacterium]|nr:helix-turn-helix domain-containing protein [Bacteroidales bacterium]
MDNLNLVLKTFEETGEPLKGGEVAQKTGIDKNEVSKHIKTLIANGKIYSPKRCFYQVK